jgi:hypothetical protein
MYGWKHLLLDPEDYRIGGLRVWRLSVMDISNKLVKLIKYCNFLLFCASDKMHQANYHVR